MAIDFRPKPTAPGLLLLAPTASPWSSESTCRHSWGQRASNSSTLFFFPQLARIISLAYINEALGPGGIETANLDPGRS